MRIGIKNALTVRPLRHEGVKAVFYAPILNRFLKRQNELLAVQIQNLLLALFLRLCDENEIGYDEDHQQSEDDLQKKPLQFVCRGTAVVSFAENSLKGCFVRLCHKRLG